MRLTISPEPALLGFLSDGPMHGYDLYKQVNSHLGLVWHVGISQMYAIVNTFADRGWVRTQVQSQDDRPSKKILELTPAGRRAFDEWLSQPAHGLREFRVDFFLRLYFARTAGAQFVQDLVDHQIDAARREMEALTARHAADAEEEELSRLTRDFRIQQLTTILKWLESHREQLVHAKPLAAPRVSGRAHSSASRGAKRKIQSKEKEK